VWTEYLIAEVLMATPALPEDIVAPLGLKHKLEADFGLPLKPPAYGQVFGTEDTLSKDRAESVSNNWYDLTSQRLYGFVSRRYNDVQFQQRRVSLRQIEKYLDLQQMLMELNLNLTDRVEYYECKCRDFSYADISSLLVMLGVRRNPVAVKGSYYRHRRVVKEKQKISEIASLVKGGPVV